MINYRLSKEADADLISVYLYTLEIWGAKQADSYTANLEQAFLKICNNTKIGIDYSRIRQKLRRFEHQEHSIYYQIEPDHILILRILGKRQDPARHL